MAARRRIRFCLRLPVFTFDTRAGTGRIFTFDVGSVFTFSTKVVFTFDDGGSFTFSASDNETNYCARCQTGGKVLADRGLSRLLGADWPRTLEELEALRIK
jgi:hypothetical protein